MAATKADKQALGETNAATKADKQALGETKADKQALGETKADKQALAQVEQAGRVSCGLIQRMTQTRSWQISLLPPCYAASQLSHLYPTYT